MVIIQKQFRIHAHHLNVLSSEAPDAALQSRRMIESLAESGDFEDTLLEALDRYKERFPEEFKTIDPYIVDVMAAVFTYHGQLNEVTRLQMLVKDSDALHAACERGHARGIDVRNNAQRYSSESAEQQAASDFAQRPKNYAPVLA